MRKLCIAFFAALLISGPVNSYSGIMEDLQNSATNQKMDEKSKKVELEFCKSCTSEEERYAKFDAVFHKALEKNRNLFTECLRRSAILFPDDVIATLAKGPVKLPNGQSVTLTEALKIIAKENIGKTTSCILALTHTISDDMARDMGIKVPENDHLKRFDATEMSVQSETSHQ